MNRVNPAEKTCNSCRLSLPLEAFYEGKMMCKVCARAKEPKQLGDRLNINPYLRDWKR